MRKRWKFILNSQLGEFELTHNPIGWDDAQNTLERNPKYHGVMNHYTFNEFGFTGEGKDYLIQLRNLEGNKLNCTLVIQEFNYILYEYETVYTGILNSRTYEESQKDGITVTMKIGESNTTENIKAREKIKILYNDNTDFNGKNIFTHGIPYVKLKLQGNEITTSANGKFQITDPESLGVGYLSKYLIQSVVFQTNNENLKSPPYIRVSDILKVSEGGWFYETFNRMSTLKLVINGQISSLPDQGLFFKIAQADKLSYQLNEEGLPVNDSGGVITDPDWLGNLKELYSEFITFPHGSSHTGRVTDININEIINVDSNKAVLMYWADATGVPTTDHHQLENMVSLTISEIPIPREIEAIKPFKLMEHIIKVIAPDSTFQSEILSEGGEFENVLFFNGYMARGYSYDKSNFSMSFEDAFQTLKILCNAGLSIDDDKVSFIPLDEIYTNEEIITINNVEKNSWLRKIDSNLLITNIKAGYSKTEYEENSGLEEYNNLNEYATSNNRVNTKIEFIPKGRGDGYGATFAIDKPATKSATVDTQYDNEIFFIDAIYNGTQYVQRGRNGFNKVENIDQITAPINLRFTPARLVINNSEQITAGIYQDTSNVIKIVSNQVPTDLVTRLSGEHYDIEESSNIETWRCKKPRFSGFIIKFGYKINYLEFHQAKIKKNGRILVYDPVRRKYTAIFINKFVMNSTTNTLNIEGYEQYEGGQNLVDFILTTHEEEVFVTNQNELINVKNG